MSALRASAVALASVLAFVLAVPPSAAVGAPRTAPSGYVAAAVKFSYSPPTLAVVSGEPVTFDASATSLTRADGSKVTGAELASTGARFDWRWCDATDGSCSPTPDATGITATHAFGFLAVHDVKDHFPGTVNGQPRSRVRLPAAGSEFPTVDPVRRRSTFNVQLAVSVPGLATQSVSQPVTIIPAIPPRADFTFSSVGAGPGQHSGVVSQDIALHSSTFDPNDRGSVVAAYWYFTPLVAPHHYQPAVNLNRTADVTCTTGGACLTAEQAHALAVVSGNPYANTFAGVTTRPVGTPLLAPGALSASRSAGLGRGRRVGPINGAPVPLCTPPACTVPLSGQSFIAGLLASQQSQLPDPSVNFARRSLSAAGLVPLGDVNLASITPTAGSGLTGDAAQNDFMRALAVDLEFGGYATGLSLNPKDLPAGADSIFRHTVAPAGERITLVVRGASGLLSAPISHDVALQTDDPPTVRLTYLPRTVNGAALTSDDYTRPIDTTSPLNFSMDGTIDGDGRIVHHVLSVGPTTVASTYPDGSPRQIYNGASLAECLTPKPQEQPPTLKLLPDPIQFAGEAKLITTPGLVNPASYLAGLSPSVLRPGVTLGQRAPTSGSGGRAHAAQAGPQSSLQVQDPRSCRGGTSLLQVQSTVVDGPLHITSLPAGDWSVTLTVFDNLGLGSVARIDGFHVVSASATCTDYPAVNLGPGHAHPAQADLVIAGRCISAYAGDGTGPRFFYTTHPLQLNGLTLRPAPNAALVVDDRHGNTVIYSTSAPDPGTGLPPNTEPPQSALDRLANADSPAVDLLVNGEPVGRFEHFTSIDSGGLIATIHGYAEPVAVSAGTTYHGFAVVTNSLLVKLGGRGASDVDFDIKLPGDFGTTTGERPTAPIHAHGELTPDTARYDKTEKDEAGIARHRPPPLRSPIARQAGNQSCSPVPDTSLDSIAVSGLSLCDDGQGTLSGEGTIAIPGLPAPAITAKFVLTNGALTSVTGTIPGEVPIAAAPGVTLKNVTFGLGFKPVRFQAGVGLSYLELLQAEGKLSVTPTPFDLQFGGSVSLGIGSFSLPLGNASLHVTADGKVLIAGGLGFDLGPVSAQVDVNGGIDVAHPGDFYLEATGQACLFVCLGVNGLVSNIGLAACGDINLGIVKLSIGFGYFFSGGLNVFASSCDLSDYKPASLRSRLAGTRTNRAGSTGCPDASAPDHADVGSGLSAVAIKVHGSPGQAPAVAIVEPGAGGRVFATTPQFGDYTFNSYAAGDLAALEGTGPRPGPKMAGTGLVDQNPPDGSTTFLVAKPAPGAWAIKPLAGSAPITCVEVADSLPPLDRAAFAATVAPAHLDARGVIGLAGRLRAGRAGGGLLGLSGPLTPSSTRSEQRRGQAMLGNPSTGAAPTFAGEAGRARIVTFQVPAGLPGRVAIIDRGPRSEQVATSFAGTEHGTLARSVGNAAASLRGSALLRAHLLIDPTPDPGIHRLFAFVSAPNGLPRAMIPLGSYTAPAPASIPQPRIAALQRIGDGIELQLAGGPVQGGSAYPVLEVAAVSSDGTSLTRIVSSREVRPARRHGKAVWTVTLRGLSPRADVTVSVRALYQGRKGPVARAVAPHIAAPMRVLAARQLQLYVARHPQPTRR